MRDEFLVTRDSSIRERASSHACKTPYKCNSLSRDTKLRLEPSRVVIHRSRLHNQRAAATPAGLLEHRTESLEVLASAW